MATITEIKFKIDLLDGAKFQELTDAIVRLENTSGSIVSYGLNSKGRAIIGSPDTYLLLEGTTIFVEASVQKTDLYNKFKNDIEKCLSIQSKTLSKIILSFTGRLDIRDVERLDKILPPDIALEILGIDEIAHLIYIKYQHLAKDYLELPIDSGQIIPVEIYLNTIDNNRYSAPLNVSFMYREDDLLKTKDLLKKVDYILMTGSPGCGKTRLALQILKEEQNRICYVIKNKTIPIHEDLSRYFQQNEKYLVLIDDANQLTQFNSMIEDFTMKFPPGDIKVIMTVRDYAKHSVCLQLENIPHKEINLKAFSKDEISNIIKNNLKIVNPTYLQQIGVVSKGNARIAYLMGLVALKENSISSIHNNQEIMNTFYRTVVEMIQSERKYIITFGIISFFGKMKIINNVNLEIILNLSKITLDDFMDAIKFLHFNEFIDVYNDSIVMTTDETMSNYIFYYIFIEEKILDISLFIKRFYNSHLKRVISVINASLAIFRDSSLLFFKESTLKIFKELSLVSKEDTIDFLTHFSLLIELEAIVFLIDYTDEIEYNKKTSIIDTKLDYSKERVNNKVLITLKALSKSKYYKEVFEILLSLINKKGFETNEVVATIYQAYKMNNYDLSSNFKAQKNVVEELSGKKTEENYIRLLEIILNNYIYLGYEETIYKEMSVGLSRFVYSDETYDSVFRRKLWRLVSEFTSEEVKVSIIKTFMNFSMIYETTEKIIQNELLLIMEYMYGIVAEYPSILTRLERISKHFLITNDKLNQLISNDEVYLYKLLNRKLIKYEHNYEEYNRKNQELLVEYAKKLKTNDIQLLINCIEKHSLIDYKVTESILTIILNVNDKYFFELLDYFLRSNSVHLSDPGYIIERIKKNDVNFLDFMSDNNEFLYKQSWLLKYYEQISPSEINQAVLNDFLIFLETYDVEGSYKYIRVEKLKGYSNIDPMFFEKYCKIALSKDYSTFSSFTGLLFNEYLTKPEQLYSLLNKNLDLYVELYFRCFKSTNYFDNNLIYLKFISTIDYEIIYKYFNIIVNDPDLSYHDYRLDFIWDMENYEEIINNILDIIIVYRKDNPFSYLFSSPLKYLEKENNKTMFVDFLKTRIKNSTNENEIAIISEYALTLNDYKLELFKTFIDSNDSFNFFMNYKIIPSSRSWSGSAIPVINNEIKELNSFFDIIPEKSKYLKHRKYLKDLIDSKVQERAWQEEREIFHEF